MLQSIPINSVTITNRIRKDLGDISALAANISELGLLSPILVNKQYQLLAGERRLTACRELGWRDIPAIIMDTADAERELAVEFAENKYRKDFNREEIVDAGIQMERIESIKAEERRISTQNNNAAKSVKAEVENFPHQEVGKTRDIVARRLGISGKQYERMKFIVEHKTDLSEGEYTDWNTGAISTNKAYGLIKKELEPKLPAPKIPKDDSLEAVQKQLADAMLKIAALQDENNHLKSDVEVFNNAAYLERNKKSPYSSLDDTDQIYTLGSKVKTMLEDDLAPLKFRRCFQRTQVSETARENLQDLIDMVQGWTTEMESLLNGSVDIIDVD